MLKGQTWHLADPRTDLKVFGGHFSHMFPPVFTSPSVQPLLQMQVALPSSDQLPSLHCSQTPFMPANVPAGHRRHRAWPRREASPCAQRSHLVLPGPGAKKLIGHCSHHGWPYALYVPAGQGTHVPETKCNSGKWVPGSHPCGAVVRQCIAAAAAATRIPITTSPLRDTNAGMVCAWCLQAPKRMTSQSRAMYSHTVNEGKRNNKKTRSRTRLFFCTLRDLCDLLVPTKRKNNTTRNSSH